jgi:hypothetical protein
MDVHAPLAITQGVRQRGVDVITAQEDGSGRLEDALLLDRATQLERVLFTQDEDSTRTSCASQLDSAFGIWN